jgi:hypothetical protein
MENEKRCSKCKRMKPITDYHKTSRKAVYKDGSTFTYRYYHAKCKVCRRLEKNIWYQEQLDKQNDTKYKK